MTDHTLGTRNKKSVRQFLDARNSVANTFLHFKVETLFYRNVSNLPKITMMRVTKKGGI